MREHSEKIQTLDDHKTPVTKMITGDEAGSSTSIYLINGSKNTTVLHVGNPVTQTEAAMKVKCCAGERWCDKSILWWTISCVFRFPLAKIIQHFSTSLSFDSCFPDVFLSEFFESSKMSRTLHATHPDESVHYPERFQEPMHPHDYRPAAEEYFDSHSSSPSLHMEQETRMHRGPRYSKNLDKITSTLLELVARK